MNVKVSSLISKLIIVFLLIEVLFAHVLVLKSNADEDFVKVNFRVINTYEDYKVYVLYPESYINYINSIKNLNHTIDSLYNNSRARTEYISFFRLDLAKKDLYEENGIKYLQIETSVTANYSTFQVDSKFPLASIKLRYTSDSRDVIIHLDKLANNDKDTVTIKYDYLANDVIKNEKPKLFNKYVVFIIIIVVALLLASSADRQIKTRKN